MKIEHVVIFLTGMSSFLARKQAFFEWCIRGCLLCPQSCSIVFNGGRCTRQYLGWPCLLRPSS
jgi:hypothetical protein